MTVAPGVVEIEVADAPDAWRAAGFTVADDCAHVGSIAIRLVGRSERVKGIRSWTWSDLSSDCPIDGLPTHTALRSAVTPGAHANGSTIIDHVVVVTPDLERTVPEFESRGLDVRRTRHTNQYGPAFRQVFFRGGETIIELIGPNIPADGDDRAAHFYGLAFTVANLDAVAREIGDGIGSIKDAVQDGRRIATLRHTTYDISVPIALMSA